MGRSAAGGRPVRVGVSSCLLGERVRWDGNHKREACIADELGRWFEWVPVCPEVEAGLGVPRPPLRLVRGRAGVRLLEVEGARDHTPALDRVARRRMRALRSLAVCGYLLKQRSPSCGLEGVAVHDPEGGLSGSGSGVFATALRRAFPELPIEDEVRLRDPELRARFVERVLAYSRRSATLPIE